MMKLIPKSVRRIALGALLVVPGVVAFAACTDLTEVPRDALTPTNAFKNDAEVLAGVASVYASLRGTMWGFYNLSEITTDEMIVPTRGSDWYDNGRWLEIHRQKWGANSGSALDDMNGTWNDIFSGIAKANLMISVIEKAGGANAPTTLAELKTLRAWDYYMLMDFFGGVPLVTTTEVAASPRVSRDSIFRFIESELNAARVNLPKTWPAEFQGRITQGAADAILASLYLNAQVYTGTVSASGLTKGTARWQDAINAADRVINSGTYSLASGANWRKNFSPDNHDSPENIFVIQHTAQPGLGMSLPMRTLHYNELTPGPWNGFATLAETYNAFDPADKRRDIFLVGQQYSFNTGLAVNDRGGKPLVFTTTIANADAATESEGARFNKFSPLPGAPSGDAHPNNFPFFRLAEMYLIKAEAQNELGQTGAALDNVNILRNRQFSPPQPLAGLSQADARDAIFKERLFEFVAEAKRRRDMIRAGTFTNANQYKGVTEPYRILFPIPATQLQTNAKLVQNPGY